MPVTFTYFPSSLPARGAESATSFFLDPNIARAKLEAAEEAGLAAIVVDDPGGGLTNLDLAAAAAAMTASLTVIATHWSGLMGPEEAAEQFAFLSRRSGGRVAIRMSAAEEAGGSRSHAADQKRTKEYLTLLRRLWLSDSAFDYEGPCYSIRSRRYRSNYRFGRGIEIRMAGQSGAALAVAGSHADVFELEPCSLFELRLLMRRVAAAAAPFGRAHKIRFAIPVTVTATSVPAHPPCSIALDDPARATLSLMRLVEAGISEFMIRGLDDTDSIRRFGQQIVRLLRNSAARLHDNADRAVASGQHFERGSMASATVRWRSHRAS